MPEALLQFNCVCYKIMPAQRETEVILKTG